MKNFGYNIGWFVLNTYNMVNTLKQLEQFYKIGDAIKWEDALGQEKGFVSPIVNNHIVLIDHILDNRADFVKRISHELGEVMYFATYRISDYIELHHYNNGSLVRSLIIDSGEVLLNIGEPSQIELELTEKHAKRLAITNKGNSNWDPIKNDERYEMLSDEEYPAIICEAWCGINPLKLDDIKIEDFGNEVFLKQGERA